LSFWRALKKTCAKKVLLLLLFCCVLLLLRLVSHLSSKTLSLGDSLTVVTYIAAISFTISNTQVERERENSQERTDLDVGETHKREPIL
jgi:hypothetical protein